jgi:hypothetical protein
MKRNFFDDVHDTVEPVAGDFLGNKTWQRISEVWTFDDDPDLAIDVGLRLAEYVVVIEALRHR